MFTGLAPGEYMVYALDSPRGGVWRSRRLATLCFTSAHVTLSPNQKGQVASILFAPEMEGDGNVVRLAFILLFAIGLPAQSGQAGHAPAAAQGYHIVGVVVNWVTG